MSSALPAPRSLDVGCGTNKSPEARFGVDIRALAGVDVVCNLEHALPFRTSSIDSIVTRHTLEHVDDLERVLREFVRVVRPGGRVRVVVPHFSNTLGFSDYTHKRFFGYYTFDYFCRQPNAQWAVPRYTPDIWFRIERKRLNFRNLSLIGPLVERVVNATPFLSYVYESKLAWLLPCFEIEFDLIVDK